MSSSLLGRLDRSRQRMCDHAVGVGIVLLTQNLAQLGSRRGVVPSTRLPEFRPVLACLGLLIAALLLWHPPALTQETTGTVSGVAKDTTGAVIRGASVVVTNLDNNSERKTVS